jgi:hypothetical protein
MTLHPSRASMEAQMAYTILDLFAIDRLGHGRNHLDRGVEVMV